MLLFKFLILAHLFADFPLQFNRLYELKTESFRGHCLHAAVCLSVMAAAGYPLLVFYQYWLIVFFISAAHLEIDVMKIRVFERLAGRDNVWAFISDQGLHLASISVVFVSGLGESAVLRQSYIGELEISGGLDFLIFLLLATFFSAFFLRSFGSTFLGIGQEQNPGASKWYGIAERGMLYCVFLLGGLYLVAVPLIVLIRIPLANHYAKQFRYLNFLNSPYSTAGNIAMAFLCSAAMRIWG